MLRIIRHHRVWAKFSLLVASILIANLLLNLNVICDAINISKYTGIT